MPGRRNLKGRKLLFAITKKKKPPSGESNASITLDYPEQNEIITSFKYVFRIDAPEQVRIVELRLNKESWKRCRKIWGYWWHDISRFKKGKYVATAKTRLPGGEILRSNARKFEVRFKKNE